VNPLVLFRRVAIAEAVTWALLLVGMFLKYVTDTTEVGVRIGGMLHGVVFVAFCVTTVVVAVDQRWSLGRTLLGLVSAVPPFATVLFDWYAERRGWLTRGWRLVGAGTEERAPASVSKGAPERPLDRPVSWLLRNPVRGALTGLVAVAALTGAALLVGPPAG
jgi:integral membrane protein